MFVGGTNEALRLKFFNPGFKREMLHVIVFKIR